MCQFNHSTKTGDFYFGIDTQRHQRLVLAARHANRHQFPSASRRSVFTRLPGRLGIRLGAAATHSCPRLVNSRQSTYPQGPAS